MGIYLNPGNNAFLKAVHSQIYVDKTGLISYTNNILGTKQSNICVSRPRRFGKSMAVDMLVAYYSRGCDSREIFSEFVIAKDPEFEKHLNKHNVIFLYMQRFLSRADGAKNLVSYLEKTVLKELKQVFGMHFEPEETHLSSALEQIYNCTGMGFVFIIDEWDCIFREKQHDMEAQTKYLDFLRDLLKDQLYVDLAYITGILPIKKYGTHSALNMFEECSMTNPKRTSEYVGFTEKEVKNLCKEYHMDFNEAKRWYDGYKFKRIQHVYNPKSVIDAMQEREFQSYWISTETYEALKIYIDMNFDGLKDAVVVMLAGGRCVIDTGSFQNDMTTFKSKDDVLTLLVHLGYLAYDGQTREVFIPNEEVRGEFVRSIKNGGWDKLANAIEKSEKLLESTLQQDADTVARGIDEVHMGTTSILSYNNENSLSCVMSLAYYSARKDYVVVREFPTGKGFADLVFLPRRHADKAVILVEMKWDKSAKGAIAQIKDKQYISALKDYAGELLLVGINYDRETKLHQCEIEKINYKNKEKDTSPEKNQGMEV